MTGAFLPLYLRCLGALSILPLGGRLLLARSALALALSLFVFVSYPFQSCGGVYEFAAGVILALPLALSVEAGTLLVQLAEIGRGQGLGEVYDPVAGPGAVSGARLIRWCLIAGLLHWGAGEHFASSFVSSLGNPCPVTQELEAIGAALVTASVDSLYWTLNGVLPFLLLFLVLDLLSGLSLRVSMASGGTGVGFQIKICLAALLLVHLSDDYAAELMHFFLFYTGKFQELV